LFKKRTNSDCFFSGCTSLIDLRLFFFNDVVINEIYSSFHGLWQNIHRVTISHGCRIKYSFPNRVADFIVELFIF
jgi:hypothetical protein